MLKRSPILLSTSAIMLLAASCSVTDDFQPADLTEQSNIRFRAAGLEDTPLTDLTVLLFDADGIYRGSVRDNHCGTVGSYSRMIDCIESAPASRY